MIVYQKKFIRIAECWIGEDPDASGVDLLRCFQQPQPVKNMFCRDFYTILLDLTQDNDALLAKMTRDTRYEIRRAAARDQFVYDYWDGRVPQVIEEFSAYFDRFATQKKQPKLNRPWLSRLAEAGALTISRIAETSGETLVWHGYHRGRDRVTLLYSASLFRSNPTSAYRNRVGRANRFQHWQDMLRFKNEGLSTYDFGGWYEKDKDQERLRINKFKEEFGGEVVRNYICERALTRKGRLFLLVRKLLLGNAI
jgi:hypothetical protein